MKVEPGFRADGALTFRLSLPADAYDGSDPVVSFVERVTERLRALPHVASVGAVDYLPLSGSASGSGHQLEDFPMAEDDLPVLFLTQYADPGYREAMGISLREGRFFEPGDHREGRRVVVVSEALARNYWPEGGALGRRISPGRPEEDGWFEIVGVVADVHHESLQVPVRGTVYYPIRGREGDNVLGRNVALVLRTGSDADPDALAPSARAAVWELDPNVPIAHVMTLDQLVADARAPMAFSMSLLLLASMLAVLLGAVGTYGVVSFVVSQRTQEIGVRMALGALRGQVRGMVLGDGLKTALPGLVLGVLGAFAVTRFMTSLLFSVSPLDSVSFVAAPLLLLLIALGSSLLPAERASRVDPIEALRRD